MVATPTYYLGLAVLLQPVYDAGREGVKVGDRDGGVERVEQLVSYALELTTLQLTNNMRVGGECCLRLEI